jgi:hypothetical protein
VRASVSAVAFFASAACVADSEAAISCTAAKVFMLETIPISQLQSWQQSLNSGPIEVVVCLR